MQTPKTIASAMALLAFAAAGCGDSTGPDPADRPWQLDLFAASYDAASAFGASCRLVEVLADEAAPVAPPWSSTVTLRAERQAGVASGPASHAEAVTLDIALDSLGPDSVRLVLSGAYPVTLVGELLPSGGYRGEWTCDGSFFFADDPSLVAAGLDAAEAIPGSWTFGPIPMPD